MIGFSGRCLESRRGDRRPPLTGECPPAKGLSGKIGGTLCAPASIHTGPREALVLTGGSLVESPAPLVERSALLFEAGGSLVERSAHLFENGAWLVVTRASLDKSAAPLVERSALLFETGGPLVVTRASLVETARGPRKVDLV